MKICILGCGLRTPLLIHGLVHSGLPVGQVALYDVHSSRAQLMARLGTHIASDTEIGVTGATGPREAIEGSSFVISSIRVGDMETRAADERLSLECGFAGQETTGTAGFAMALRTIPVALEHARLVERYSPSAWIVNFTNPAGLITQAIATHTKARVVGICDTPAELIFQIARVLGEPREAVQCDYFGLNHLGWVRSVKVRGVEVISRLLDDEHLLRRLYPAALFPAPLIQALGMIPTEYLFFYYNQALARGNQQKTGATRATELEVMNREVWADLEESLRAGTPETALTSYRSYLNRRNGSYMRLEGDGKSAFQEPDHPWDPFEGETGYHRIAVDALRAFTSRTPHSLILNVANRGAIEGLGPLDVVEVRCLVDESGPLPLAAGPLPNAVKGLVHAVKHFERLTIQAAVERRLDLAALALSVNPIIGSWDPGVQFLSRLADSDPVHFSSYSRRELLLRTSGN